MWSRRSIWIISDQGIRLPSSGHITTCEQVQSGHERLLGYRKALQEVGILYDPKLVRTGENSPEAGAQCMRELLDLPDGERPSAVFINHDTMAAGAYGTIRDAGLTIPQDISIVGHDNNPISQLLLPRLTTMDTFKYRLGEVGVDLLIEEIREAVPLNREIVCETELIIRESVAPYDH